MKMDCSHVSYGVSPSPKSNKLLADVRRKSFLSEKGIKPNSAVQLDLLYPDIIGGRSDLRHIPNDYARSSLFCVRNKSRPRKAMTQELLFHYNEHVSIYYTGIELRAEDDEIVWLQILNYGQSVPLGDPFEFGLVGLVKDLGWSRNGRSYDHARECISRLKASEVLAHNHKSYGVSESVSLIKNYTALNDSRCKPTHFRVWIDPGLVVMFAGSAFTSHLWETYRKLSPVARRLADYICSHKQPFPLDILRFKSMCGSCDLSLPSWRQTVRAACSEACDAGISVTAFLGNDDRISFVR